MKKLNEFALRGDPEIEEVITVESRAK